MPDDITGIGAGQPADAIGGLPAAEKLAVTYGLLQNIHNVIAEISRNPLTSGYGIQRLGNMLDQYWIKNLKESNKLSKEAAERFEKMAQKGTELHRMFLSVGGAAFGAGLRLAYMTEQLERQATTVTRYARLVDMPGGVGGGAQAMFRQAQAEQAFYFGTQQQYGREIAQRARQEYQSVFTAMRRGGINTPGEQNRFVQETAIMSQFTGLDMGRVLQQIADKGSTYGLTIGRAKDATIQLYDASQKGKFGMENFGDSMEGVRDIYESLVGTHKDPLGGAAALQMSMANAGYSRDQQMIFRQLIPQVMRVSTAGAFMAGAQGAGYQVEQDPIAFVNRMRKTDPIEIARMYQTIMKQGLAQGPVGEERLQRMFNLDPGQQRIMAASQLQDVERLNLAYEKLDRYGGKISKSMQDAADAATDWGDQISGWVSEKLNALAGLQIGGKPLGGDIARYAPAAIGALLTIGIMKKYKGALGLLLASQAGRMGGEDAGGNIAGDLMTMYLFKSMLGKEGAAGLGSVTGPNIPMGIGGGAAIGRGGRLLAGAGKLARGVGWLFAADAARHTLGEVIKGGGALRAGERARGVFSEANEMIGEGDVVGAADKMAEAGGIGIGWGINNFFRSIKYGGGAVGAAQAAAEEVRLGVTPSKVDAAARAGVGEVVVRFVGPGGDTLASTVVKQGEQQQLRISTTGLLAGYG